MLIFSNNLVCFFLASAGCVWALGTLLVKRQQLQHKNAAAIKNWLMHMACDHICNSKSCKTAGKSGKGGKGRRTIPVVVCVQSSEHATQDDLVRQALLHSSSAHVTVGTA
jgi:hypothetical protein